MNILIIGATGYIGKALYKKCLENHNYVIGTSRKEESDSGIKEFHIGNNIDDIDNILSVNNKPKYAIICGGQSNIAQCKAKKQEAYQINVAGTKKLINQLKEKKYKIIFCSTDNVYDGEKGNYTETNSINPINEYGKMKVEIEDYLLSACANACVIRISKVIGDVTSGKDMLNEWKDKAYKKETIYCIKDNYFSPVHIDDVVNVILEILEKNLCGVYNICGNTKYGRIDLCKRFLDVLELTTEVKEKNIEEFGFNDKRPLDTSMSNQKFVNDTGYRFKKLEKYFVDYLT